MSCNFDLDEIEVTLRSIHTVNPFLKKGKNLFGTHQNLNTLSSLAFILFKRISIRNGRNSQRKGKCKGKKLAVSK